VLRRAVALRPAAVGPERAVTMLLVGFAPQPFGFAQPGVNLGNESAHEVLREPLWHDRGAKESKRRATIAAPLGSVSA